MFSTLISKVYQKPYKTFYMVIWAEMYAWLEKSIYAMTQMYNWSVNFFYFYFQP